MDWNELVSLRISELVLKQILQDKRIKIKKSEEACRKQVVQKLMENFQQEKNLIEEVYKMMEDLENQGQKFERQKIFPLLKFQLAKKKGFIL